MHMISRIDTPAVIYTILHHTSPVVLFIRLLSSDSLPWGYVQHLKHFRRLASLHMSPSKAFNLDSTVPPYTYLATQIQFSLEKHKLISHSYPLLRTLSLDAV